MAKNTETAAEDRNSDLSSEQDYFDQWNTRYSDLYPAGTRHDLEFRLSRMLVFAGRSWVNKIDLKVRAATGQTRARWQVLFTLSFGEQPVTVTELCRRLRVRWPTIVRVIEGLSNDGLVTREENPADGRSKLVSLTSKGIEMVHRIQPILDRERAAIVSRLSDAELKQCAEMLERILEDTVRTAE